MHKHRCAICIQHCYRLLCKTPATQTNTHNSATSFCQWKTEIKKKPKRRRRENKTKTTTKSIHTRKIERYWDFVSHFWRGWSSGVKLCTLFESRKFPSSAHLLCIRHCFSFRCIYETGKGSCGKIGCVELSQRRAKGDTNKKQQQHRVDGEKKKKARHEWVNRGIVAFTFFPLFGSSHHSHSFFSGTFVCKTIVNRLEWWHLALSIHCSFPFWK